MPQGAPGRAADVKGEMATTFQCAWRSAVYRFATVRPNQGFTLLELLVVVLVIALLAGYVGPKLFGEIGKARSKTAAAQMKTLSSALDRYRLDTGRLPSTDQGLKALVQDPGVRGWHGPYLDNDVPLDPWSHPYVYSAPGKTGRDYDLMSYGADGKPGGTGEDADIAAH
jgi:general secretion pathway protein G